MVAGAPGIEIDTFNKQLDGRDGGSAESKFREAQTPKHRNKVESMCKSHAGWNLLSSCIFYIITIVALIYSSLLFVLSFITCNLQLIRAL